MSVTPAANALAKAADFLAYFGELPDDDGKQTDKAQRLINAYSKAIHMYAKRQFLPIQNATDKIFAYSGNGYLSLAPFEARAVYQVTLHSDLPTTGWLVLNNQSDDQESQYRLNPRHQTEEGTYWSITLPEVGPFHPYYDEPVTTLNRRNLGYQVTVNGDWGVGSVPSDVEMALFIAVANAWRNPEGYGMRHLGALQFQDAAPIGNDEEGLALPRASRALLSGYRRRTVR